MRIKTFFGFAESAEGRVVDTVDEVGPGVADVCARGAAG